MRKWRTLTLAVKASRVNLSFLPPILLSSSNVLHVTVRRALLLMFFQRVLLTSRR